MPQVFLTAVWGFDPESWAAIGFTQVGNRDALLREYKSGDFVAIFGTMGSETDEADRGNLLGLVQLIPKAIETKFMVHPDLWNQKLADQGSKKWIAGLPMSMAWRFEKSSERALRNLVPRFADKKYHRTLASRYELLDADEANLVLSLPRIEIEAIYKSDEMVAQEKQAFMFENAKTRRNGPPPTFGESIRSIGSSPAFVYALEFQGDLKIALGKQPHEIGNKSLFKIGWSVDAEQRRKQINAYMPDENIMGWKSAADPLTCERREGAYLKEQLILKVLERFRHKGEMVLCTKDDLHRVWNEYRFSEFSDDQLEAAREKVALSMLGKL